MATPKVTFLVPCYRLAHFLAGCVTSILAQTYRDFEVLVLDDCSPDDTEEVVKSLVDVRVKHVRNEQNLGHLRNYNKGLGLAKGEYVWLISADDRLRKPYILERYMEVMETRPGIGFAFCPGIGLMGQQETAVVAWSSLGQQDSVLNGRAFLRRLLRANCVLAPSGLVRRECYERVGVFPLDLPFAGDWYLWCAFSLYYDVAYFAEPMVNYREHSESMTESLIGEDVRLLARDDIAVRWRIKRKLERAGYTGLTQYCGSTIVEDYIQLLTSKTWRGTKFRMSLEEFDRSLVEHARDLLEGDGVRTQVLAGVGSKLYWDPEFKTDLRLYQLALEYGGVNPKLWLKYGILRLGTVGVRIMHLLTLLRGAGRGQRRRSFCLVMAPTKAVVGSRTHVGDLGGDRRRRICIITQNASFGGMEVHTLGLMEALIGRGYGIDLVSNRYYGYDEFVQQCGWFDQVSVLHTALSGILYGERSDRRGWRRVLRGVRSEVLIFPKGNNNFGQIGFLRECRRAFRKIIFIEHLEPHERPKKALRRWWGRVPGIGLWWYRRKAFSKIGSLYADHIVAVSEKIRERLAKDFGYAPSKLSVVQNGVHWQHFLRSVDSGRACRARYGMSSNAFVFGMLTRLSQEKGIDIALRAIRLLVDQYRERSFLLVIAGEGYQADKLRELADTLDLDDRVRFIGFVPRPEEVLSAYDVILFSSNVEGLPLGLLQGMAAGCVPIVTRVGGMPEAVNSPDVGWVVSPGNPEELCRAMKAALSLGGEELSLMRENACARIRREFDIAESHRRILEVCGL
jgi:glycosyltransferase involved in cell wall biosynthesis